jgi:hypothetical protein
MADPDPPLTKVQTDDLLYDEDTFDDVCDVLYEHDIPVKPTEIKKYVETNAKLYEIRTAFEYYSGGKQSYRTSDRVWQRLAHINSTEGDW